MRESRAVEREARSLKGLLSEPLKGDRAMAAAVARTRKGPQMQLMCGGRGRQEGIKGICVMSALGRMLQRLME